VTFAKDTEILTSTLAFWTAHFGVHTCNNNNKYPHLPLRVYIDNPDMLHKSYLYRGQLYLCTIVYLTFLCKSMRLSAHTPQNYFQSPDWSTNQKLGNISMVYRDTVTLFKGQPNFLCSLQKRKGMVSRLTK
jgi:hypothetical protein